MALKPKMLGKDSMTTVREAIAEVNELDTEDVGHFAVVAMLREHPANDHCTGFHEPTTMSTLHEQHEAAAFLDVAVEQLIDQPIIGIVVTKKADGS